MKRLVAVLGAVAMIGAAVLVRGAITSDGGGGGGGGGAADDGETRLICVTELEAACTALAAEDDTISFDVEEAGATAARLTNPAFRPSESDIDGWLTLEPWPGLVDLRRDIAGDNPVLGEPSDVVATSPLDIVGPTARLDPLINDVCDAEPESPVWRCLGDNAGASWASAGGDAAFGNINVGYADPTDSATGLLLLGQSSAEYFDAVNGQTFARNDFDPAFQTWLSDLNDSDPKVSTSGSPLDQLLRVGVSSWDAVGDVDWVAEEKVAGSRDEDALTVTYSSFMLAEAVAVPIVGRDIPDFTDGDFRNVLVEAGYENPAYDVDPATSVTAISAGVYQALIEEWEQADR